MDVYFILHVLAVLASFYVGVNYLARKTAHKSSGIVVFDRSDPDGITVFLELPRDVSINELSKRDTLTFDVVNRNYISR